VSFIGVLGKKGSKISYFVPGFGKRGVFFKMIPQYLKIGVYFSK
jgi:hypothetical protein